MTVLLIAVGLTGGALIGHYVGTVGAPSRYGIRQETRRGSRTIPGVKEDPYGGEGQSITLDQATSSAGYTVLTPNDDLANAETLVDTWMVPSTSQIAVTYASGVRVYMEPWQGLDGLDLYKEQLANGYSGQIVTLRGNPAITSAGGTNSDGSPFPPVVRFTENKVTFKLLVLPGFQVSVDDLIRIASTMKQA
jgi:hypothetical protein